MTAEEYRALLDVDFNNVKIEDLTDIRKIKIDKNQPQIFRHSKADFQMPVPSTVHYSQSLP